jgi:hypothetical protein
MDVCVCVCVWLALQKYEAVVMQLHVSALCTCIMRVNVNISEAEERWIEYRCAWSWDQENTKAACFRWIWGLVWVRFMLID